MFATQNLHVKAAVRLLTPRALKADLPMTEAVAHAVKIPVVASGGAGKPEHLEAAFRAGADAAVAASIFHYNEYSVPVTKRYLAGRGIPIRL